MLSKKAKENIKALDTEIGLVLDALNGLTVDDPSYATTLEHLTKLYKIKDQLSSDPVAFKDWIPVIGSVGGIVVLVVFEATGHTMTSKALSFVSKLKS